MGYDSTDVKHTTSGVSVPLAWAMFGGSTFILFLLCYFCQKKLQDEDMTIRNYDSSPRQIYVIPTSNHHHHQVPGVAFPPLPSPPPDYSSVTKKDPPVFEFDCDPPSYETAVSSVHEQVVEENGNSVKRVKPGCCSVPETS